MALALFFILATGGAINSLVLQVLEIFVYLKPGMPIILVFTLMEVKI